MLIVCKGCGKEFTSSNNKKRYCSKECSGRAYPKKVCKECGKEFTPEAHNQLFCTKECRIEYNNTQRRGYPAGVFEKKCQQCGKLFTTKKFTKSFCSKRCGGIYYNHFTHEHSDEMTAAEKVKKAKYEAASGALVDTAVEAREAGMSYGEYVAKKQLEARAPWRRVNG